VDPLRKHRSADIIDCSKKIRGNWTEEVCKDDDNDEDNHDDSDEDNHDDSDEDNHDDSDGNDDEHGNKIEVSLI